MKNLGVRFQIPNQCGRYLYDILEPISFNCYQWLLDNDEIHLVNDSKFTGEFLFNSNDEILSWEELLEISKSKTYYMVFITLRAFKKDGVTKRVSTYEEFLKSDCEIILTVYDCSYGIYWCKDSKLVSRIYEYAIAKSYEAVEYISEEDLMADKYRIE